MTLRLVRIVFWVVVLGLVLMAVMHDAEAVAKRASQWVLYHVVDWGAEDVSIPEPQLIAHELSLGTFKSPVECARFAKSLATYAVVDRRKAGEVIQALPLPDTGYTVFDGERWTRTRLLCRPEALDAAR